MKGGPGQHITTSFTQSEASAPHKAIPPPGPACGRPDLCPQHSMEVTLGPGTPVSSRLNVSASFGACRDRRAGQSSGEDQGLGQGIGAIGLGGVEGKRLQVEVLAATGCGHGARPPACHPRFPHGEGRKLPIPGPLAGGGEQGVGLSGGWDGLGLSHTFSPKFAKPLSGLVSGIKRNSLGG